MQCFFVSDLHGRRARYEKLLGAIERDRPDAVFMGGDLLPHGSFRGGGLGPGLTGTLEEYLIPRLEALRDGLGAAWPRIFVILGNDDGRLEEETVVEAAGRGLWDYVHGRSVPWGEWTVHGYAYVPPTPFRLKDWERYDVSRFVDPGCVSPEEGFRTVPVPDRETRYGTIREDLEALAAGADMEKGLFLFHSPPYRTNLDRAALDGRMVEGVPMDVHVGSIAIKGFIEARQPLLTMHGHIHESASMTGSWRDRIGRTHCLSAAHDGPELALVRFDPRDPSAATRDLL